LEIYKPRNNSLSSPGLADIPHFSKEAACAMQTPIQQKHLSIQRNRNAFVVVLKAMELVDTEEKVREIGLKRWAIVIVLNRIWQSTLSS